MIDESKLCTYPLKSVSDAKILSKKDRGQIQEPKPPEIWKHLNDFFSNDEKVRCANGLNSQLKISLHINPKFFLAKNEKCDQNTCLSTTKIFCLKLGLCNLLIYLFELV